MKPLLRKESQSKASTILLAVACLLAGLVAGYFGGKNDFQQLSQNEAVVGVLDSAHDGKEIQHECDVGVMSKLKAPTVKETPEHLNMTNEWKQHWKVTDDQWTIDLVKEVCDQPDQKHLSMWWLTQYHNEWGVYPLQALDAVQTNFTKQLWEQIKACADKDPKTECKFDIKLLAQALGALGQDNLKMDAIKSALGDLVEKGVSKAVDRSIQQYINRNVAAAFVGLDLVGNGLGKETEEALKNINWAKEIEESTNTEDAAAQGIMKKMFRYSPKLASKMNAELFVKLANPALLIGSFAAEQVTGLILTKFGVTNPRIIEIAKSSAGFLFAIAVGGMVGGPIGAAAGAGMAAVSWVVGESFGAMFRAFVGPDDNWCYVKVGKLDPDVADAKIGISVYGAEDFWYAKSYQNKYFGAGDADFFSAGNAQDGSFQVSIYDEHGHRIKSVGTVNYRDTFFIQREENKDLSIVLARGGFSTKSAGKIEKYTIPARK